MVDFDQFPAFSNFQFMVSNFLQLPIDRPIFGISQSYQPVSPLVLSNRLFHMPSLEPLERKPSASYFPLLSTY